MDGRTSSAREVVLIACLTGAAISLTVAATAAANKTPSPVLQPSSIAFVDRRHGVLAEEDWGCGKAHGCPARILVSADGGTSWRVTYHATMPIRLYPVRGTLEVWASTGASVIESRDGGSSWRRMLSRPAAAIGFATANDGWLIGTGGTFGHPRPLLATRDGGHTWRRIAGPCRGDFGIVAAVAPVSASRGWTVCTTQSGTGFQGKAIWQTDDGGAHWRLRSRVHPIGPPKPALRVGAIDGFGYVTGMQFLPGGQGWLWEDRGWLLTTTDGGLDWRKSPLTKPDQIAAQSASLLDRHTGYMLLRGCTVRLVRTTDGGRTWTTAKSWHSPTQC